MSGPQSPRQPDKRCHRCHCPPAVQPWGLLRCGQRGHTRLMATALGSRPQLRLEGGHALSLLSSCCPCHPRAVPKQVLGKGRAVRGSPAPKEAAGSLTSRPRDEGDGAGTVRGHPVATAMHVPVSQQVALSPRGPASLCPGHRIGPSVPRLLQSTERDPHKHGLQGQGGGGGATQTPP